MLFLGRVPAALEGKPVSGLPSGRERPENTRRLPARRENGGPLPEEALRCRLALPASPRPGRAPPGRPSACPGRQRQQS